MGEGQNGPGTYRRGACQVHSFPDLSLPSPHRSRHWETHAAYFTRASHLYDEQQARVALSQGLLAPEGLSTLGTAIRYAVPVFG